MTTLRGAREEAHLQSLVRELAALPAETPWLEFKHNKADPQDIGEYLSALANAAALEGKARAYLLWGVDDANHALIGTDFDPAAARVGAEELESWLLRLLTPKIGFRFHRVVVEGRPLVLLEIDRAVRHPVRFAGIEYLRIGSYKKKLKEFPEHERTLWRIFDTTPFELLPAAEHLAADEVLQLLDYPAYFDLLARPLPDGREALLQALAADGLLWREDSGHWTVRNLGALLFAKRLSDFGGLRRKAVRVVVYGGPGRASGAQREQEGGRGYAAGFAGLIGFINGLLPGNEVLGQALRKTVPVYPELAVRELGCQCADPSGLGGHWRGADGRAVQRPHGGHQPRRATGRHPTPARQPATLSQRGAGVADAARGHLRGAGQRRGQGGVADRAVPVARSCLRRGGRLDAQHVVHAPAVGEDGSCRPPASGVPARLPALRRARLHDQRDAARALRPGREEQCGGFTPAEGRTGGPRHQAARPGGAAQVPQVRAVVGMSFLLAIRCGRWMGLGMINFTNQINHLAADSVLAGHLLTGASPALTPESPAPGAWADSLLDGNRPASPSGTDFSQKNQSNQPITSRPGTCWSLAGVGSNRRPGARKVTWSQPVGRFLNTASLSICRPKPAQWPRHASS